MRRAGSSAIARASTGPSAAASPGSVRAPPAQHRAVGVASGHHVEEQRAEGEDVAARDRRGARAGLGREVAGRAEDHRRAGERALAGGGLDEPGDAEVSELGAPVVAEQDVLGLDVAVNDAAPVRVGDRVAQLPPDGERVGDGEGAASASEPPVTSCITR